MSSCSDLRPLTQSFLDSELAESELRDFEGHLTECADCRAVVDEEQSELVQLRNVLAPPNMPEELRSRVVATLDQEDSARLRQRRRNWASWTLPVSAGLAAAAALLLFVLKSPTPQQEVAVEQPLAKEAVRQKIGLSPTPVVQGTRNEVSRSAEEYLRVPVRAPRFSRDDVALLGWKPSQLQGNEAAVFLYEASSRGTRNQVSVHVVDAPGLRLRGSDRRIVNERELWVDSPFGYSSVTYQTDDGLVYVFSSDMKRDDLVELVGHSDIMHQVNEQLRR